MSARQWISTTRSARCPICGKAGWCRLSADGQLAACRRVEQGAARVKTDKAGAPVYIHRIGDSTDPPPRLDPPMPSANRADADARHRVYSALLAALPLSSAHREALRRRGLTDAQIDAGQYRTLPVQGRAPIARQLMERFGDAELLAVPGFVAKDGERGIYISIAGAAGLMIPCRSDDGRVAALKVRRDESGDGPRYSYISSAKYGGPTAELCCHVPIGAPSPCDTVRITEGELKADVSFAISGIPTISIPGVFNFRPAIPVLRELRTRAILLAFDADAREKETVARALQAALDGLAGEGFFVSVERWDGAKGKGIDDLLVTGGKPERLDGDAARAFVAECAASAASSGAEQRLPSPLDRLSAALDGGAEKLFADGALLDALARLAESDPAEWQCVRAKIKSSGIGLKALDAAIAPIRQRLRAAAPPLVSAGEYRVSAGCIVRQLQTKDGPVDSQLANFSARIVEQTTIDDGADRAMFLALEGSLRDGTPLPRVEISADQFGRMEWIIPAWGTRAVIAAGPGARDHLRAAIQNLSGDVPTRTVYGHTGWKNIGGEWAYLHGGGGIGANGAVDGIETRLPDSLSRFVLPPPPDGEELRRAVRAALSILDVAPPRIAWPLLAAVFRAPLGHCDSSLFLCGPTGVGKSELSALAQQHFGAAMTRERLPGTWAATANSLESLAFTLKDSLLAVDDFAPGGSGVDIARLNREADRLLRAAGNGAGRGRMRRDGTLTPARPPRGLILASGEDMPRGQSLAARLLSVPVKPGDVRFDALTRCQADAADGLCAGSMAGYVRWLAGRYESAVAGLAAERGALRDAAGLDAGHKRTPNALADFGLGVRYLLRFAVDVGAISAVERERLWREAWDALQSIGAEQAKHIAAADPVDRFIALLGSSISSGVAHVASADGDKPAIPNAWGWREEPGRHGPEWRPLGRRIGWIDRENLYLDPEGAHAVVQALGTQTGEPLAVSARTLRARLHERGLLASVDAARETLTVRRTLDGAQRSVLHMISGALFGEFVGSNCLNVGSGNGNPTSKNATISSENGENVGFVGSQAMEIVGGENNNFGDAYEPPHDGPPDADALDFPFGANGV